jgi:hypothetical protein
VTGVSEAVNVRVRYIPSDKVIDICSYREFFETLKTNLSIEDIADLVFGVIKFSANPKALEVEIFLEDPRLTPWSVLVSE